MPKSKAEKLVELHSKSFVDWSESEWGFYVDRWYDETRERWFEGEQHRRPVVWPERQKRVMRYILTIGSDGKLPLHGVWWIDIGQSGKSLFAAAAAQWFGFNVDSGSEVQLAANSREHAGIRTYKALRDSLKWNPHGPKIAKWDNKKLIFKHTNNEVRPVPTRAGSVSGGHPVFRHVDEIWNYEGDEAEKLVAELKETPSRNISFLLVTSYPGFEDDEGPLNAAIDDFFDEFGEPREGVEKVEGLEDLPFWVKKSVGQGFWWNHDPYPWHLMRDRNGIPFIERQKNQPGVTENHFLRIWKALRTQREDTFMPMKDWDACEDKDLLPLQPEDRDVPLVLAVDLSTKHDDSTGIARTIDPITGRLLLKDLIVVHPQESEDNLEELKQWIWRTHRTQKVLACYYDPYQFEHPARDLRRKGVNMIEITQNTMRITADTQYRRLIVERMLRNYPGAEELRSGVRNAVAVELGNGTIRLDKRKAKKRIDPAVGDSMCCYGCMEYRREFERLARKAADPFQKPKPPRTRAFLRAVRFGEG